MSQVAKLFNNGRSQAVRLPAAYRFQEKEVYIRKDPITNDIILSRKPATWDGFLDAVRSIDTVPDFMNASERSHGSSTRDPFKGWTE